MKLNLFFLLILCLVFDVTSSVAYAQTSSSPWGKDLHENQGFSSDELQAFKDTLAARGTKKLLVIRNGKAILSWFAKGWKDQERKHYIASLDKAVVSGLSLILAMQDSLIYPDAPACRYIQPWRKSKVKSKITVRQLATHTSGIEDAESSKPVKGSLNHEHMTLPGWKGQFWRKQPDPFSVALHKAPVIFTPGTAYAYSNPGYAMLNYAVTASLQGSGYTNIRSYLKGRIYSPLGINPDDYSIGYGKTYEVNGLQLVPGWGGGDFTAEAIAKIGSLMLHDGNWRGKQLLDSSIVKKSVAYSGTPLPPSSRSSVPRNWREIWSNKHPEPAPTLGWYNNFDGIWPLVPRDAFVGAGAGHQILLVIPSLNLVMVRLGDKLAKGENFWEPVEKYILNPLMRAIVSSPYPKSSKYTMSFATSNKVIRLAKGSDNWPVTWGQDSTFYTAYGDGWGFHQDADIKLSLGLATVKGTPPHIKGQNLYSSSGETVGQGKHGRKASGMLMVDDTLYMLTRNANNAQLAWSDDQGKTWNWADWRFKTSFGYPTFLNYGPNYKGARDNYVYLYSPDTPSAYKIADQMVLARVKKEQIKHWRAYKYFSGFNDLGEPIWSNDIRRRKPVFKNPAKCYRSSISYNLDINRYMWVQTTPFSADGARFKGSLGIYVSKNPWGPWKTFYYSPDWDIGPGETASIPTFWLSDDGRAGYLLFSGNDAFSLRKFKIQDYNN